MSVSQVSSEQTGQYVQANGLRVYFEAHGSGIPLLLIHGAFYDSQSWQALIPAFAAHFRVITPDSRGHGRTDNPAGHLSYPTMADDVAALIQVLDLDRPLLFGFSDGGQIALELGMRYPNLARALVIGGAWYIFSDPYWESLSHFGIDHSGAVDFPYLVEKAPSLVEFLEKTHHSADPDYWQTLMREYGVLFSTPLDYTAVDFQKIVDPTLILSGDRDHFIPLDQPIGMYRQIPNAELAIFPHEDHGTWLRQDGPAIPVMLDFLKRYST
jgi:pimeloyl-ACP methyl ester carboxylesterase